MLKWQHLHLTIAPPRQTPKQNPRLSLSRTLFSLSLNPILPNQGFSARFTLFSPHPTKTSLKKPSQFQSMAPALSRSLASASVASLPSFSSTNAVNRVFASRRSAFIPQNGLRNSFSKSGLKWKVERRETGLAVRCEAAGGAAVAEKEVPEASGERHEYQAEVGFNLSFFPVPFGLTIFLVLGYLGLCMCV